MLRRQKLQELRLSCVDPSAAVLGYIVPMSKGTPWHKVATDLRKKKRITLQQMADRLGYAKSTVGHWLTGHNPAPYAIIQEIAVILGTTEIALIADDPFYISDPTERRLIEQLRNIPENQRELAIRAVDGTLHAFLFSAASRSDKPTT